MSARGRHVFGRRPKKRAAKLHEENLLRLDVCRSQANRELKVARLDFFRGIPPKFEPYLRRHELRHGKKVTTTVLHKDENFL